MSARLVMTIVGLRLLRVVKEKVNLVWLFLVPLMFSGLMGMLMGNWDRAGSLPSFRVFCGGDSTAVATLLAPLRDNGTFKIMQTDTLIAAAAAQRIVERGRATAILLVPAGFADSLASGGNGELSLYYNSDRLSSQTVRTELERAVLGLNARVAARRLAAPASQVGERSRAAQFDEEAFGRHVASPRVTLSIQSLGRAKQTDLPLDDSHQHLGPAYTLMFVFMFLMMSAKDLVVERQSGTLARLKMSHVSPWDVMVGYLVAGLLLGLFQAAVLLVVNSLLFGIDYGNAPACLAVVVLLFAAVGTAWSLLMGCLCRTPAQADGLGTAISLLLAALGGLWWPLEIVAADFMRNLGLLLPTGQAITVFHNMIGRGYGIAENAGLLFGLALYFVVLLPFAVWRFRRMVVV